MDKTKTLFIYDWDDTLFPSTWTFNENIQLTNIGNTVYAHSYNFEKIDMVVSKLLSETLKYGKIIIVTNANREWINMSSVVLPTVSEILKKNIDVFSARDLYQNNFPIEKWKRNTFQTNILEHINASKQIISIGDDVYEYEALVSLNKTTRNKKYLKTIKLEKYPSVDKLIDQLNVLKRSIKNICEQKSHMDLKFINLFDNDTPL